jgi:iron complex outermembrane receptor protein
MPPHISKVAQTADERRPPIKKPVICWTWLSPVGFLFSLAPSVLAQEPSPTPGTVAEAERVVVTGSNIPTAEEVGPNPVLIINRDLIETSGERTTEELIRNLTVAGPNGVPTSNNGGSLAAGASSISLRGFDASSTLTLIDGRRVAPYPFGTGNGAVTFVDLNSIPRAAIESIEILKDGASSIYGADAVAGVVNIKLRHDYRGAEATVEYGNTLDKDSGEFAASLVFGVGDVKTSVSGVLNFYHRNSIFNRDRGYSSKTPFPSVNSSPINIELSREAVLAAGVSPDHLPPGEMFFGHAPFFTNGAAPAADYDFTTISRFNYNAFSTSLPDSERYGGFINTTHKIFGEQMVLFADLLYQNVQTRYQLAPSPTGGFQTPGNVTLAIPPHAPGPTLGGPSYQETGVPPGAFNPFNPFQQIISGSTRGRLAEFENRIIRNTTDAFLSTLGLKGDRLFDGSWGYDAGFRYSEIKNTSRDTVVSASRFNRILNAADPIFDPGSPQFIGTTVPYDPFGDYRVPIPSNSLPTAFATIHPKSIDRSRLATIDLNIYSTSLFELPAGGVGLAFGGQFRRETLKQEPDESYIIGDIIGTGGSFLDSTQAGRKAYAFYAEARLPVFSPIFSVPGFHSLEFTAAGRFEAFRNNDTNVLVPKFGMRWQPFDNSFTVRATWGEGFHQPSLIELFGNPQQGLISPPLFDPVTQTRVFDVPFIVRSNPNLEPEDSRSFSGGFVYTPKFVRGLTLTIDFYDIESKGRVAIPDFQNVVDRSVEGRLLPLEAVNRGANGQIVSLEEAFQNSGSQKARGVDLGLQYQIGTRFGVFTWLTQASYLDSFQFAQLPGEKERELRSGVLPFSLSDEAYLKWRANSRLDWAWHGYDLVVTAHYLDGFHETLFFFPGREHYVKQTWFFDVQASYTFSFVPPVEAQPVVGYSKDTLHTKVSNDGQATAANTGLPIWKCLLHDTTVTIGCNNVFGHDPPHSLSNVGYPSFLYDSTGRFVYLSLTKKF